MGRVEELLQCVLSLYGAGLERVLETVGPEQVRRLADDELVGNLLVLGGLHPDDVDTRVQRALDQVRPYLGSHAGGVSLSGVDADGVVHLRLEGSCDGCPSSALTVKSAIEDAILVAAPDVVAVEAEGMVSEEPALLQIGRFEPHDEPSRADGGLDAPRPRRAARDDGPRARGRCRGAGRQPVRHPGGLPRPLPGLPAGAVARDARRRRAHLRLRDVVRRAPRGPRLRRWAASPCGRCRCCRRRGRGRSRSPPEPSDA